MLTANSDYADRESSPAVVALGSSFVIDEIVREGARRMLAEALRAEVDAYRAGFVDERDENGRPLVVRNGYHEPREVTTCAGAVQVTAPRVNDKRIDPETGERQRFSSAILPPWPRKSPQIQQVLPLLYLHGLSSGGFRSRAGAVPRLGQRVVGGDDHQDDPDLAGRAAGVRTAGPLRRGLRVCLGRRDPCQRALGQREAVSAGADRSAQRRPQGTRRADRRIPGGHGVVGGSTARLQAPRHARAGAGDRRWCAGVLGGAARGVPGHQRAALLVSQDL